MPHKRRKIGRRIRRNWFILRRLTPRSLYVRAILIMAMPLLVVQIVATIVFFNRHWSTVTRRLAAAVASEISLIEEQLPFLTPTQQDNLLAQASATLDLSFSLQDSDKMDNSPIWHSTLTDTLVEELRKRQIQNATIHNFVPGEVIDIRIPTQMSENDKTLRILAPLRRLYTSTAYIFLLWMSGTSMVLFGIAVIFIRNQIKPIARLAKAADAFGKGQDIPWFKLEGGTEVRAAAAAFLTMKERLKRQIAQRTEMLAGVSHDLRTPLTRIRLELEMMRPGHAPSSTIESLKLDVIEMEQMVESYLAFARGADGETPAETDLATLLEDMVERMDNPKRFTLETDGDLLLMLRPLAIKRCLDNLIRNAARYAPHVHITARRHEKNVSIRIEDDGPGIAEPHREEVFRPFHRLDTSRNSDTGGVGLGMAIARDIARSHGGNITLGDSELGGLLVNVTIPC